ncbi:hypothetical protein H7100_00015 [Candidatus Saccharibacteria bacterium]|nr:hypothetical protein [Candidatus Saccharibacteria bacterium]
MMGRILKVLLSTNTSSAPRSTIDKIIEHESKVGAKVFSSDPDVTDVKYFFLPDEQGHKWYYQQISTVRSKNFTNSYSVTETGIEKSSTYYDEQLGRIVNVSTTVDDAEANNLLIAAKKYYSEVTGKVYVKKPIPRFRFGSKNAHDLMA